jgi:hypothetical protein
MNCHLMGANHGLTFHTSFVRYLVEPRHWFFLFLTPSRINR